jgi:hypothetical protein
VGTRSNQAGAGDWIAERLHGFAEDVGSNLPEGFPAYVRLLHPAARVLDDLERVKTRWAEIAAAAGVCVEARTQFEDFRVQDMRLEEPDTGGLPADELRALVETLAGSTTTPGDCWLAVWDGHAQLMGPPAVANLRPLDGSGETEPAAPAARMPDFEATMEAPGRGYLLHHGPIDDAHAINEFVNGDGPNLWWPEDRAWVVASDIDLASTYVAGSVELAERLVGDGRLEALRVEIGSPISLDRRAGPPR